MGSGSYSSTTFSSYSRSKGIAYDSSTRKMASSVTHQDIFKATSVDSALDPYRVLRECCDSAEHPFTKPIVLGLDITGSMGDASTETASSLGVIMSNLYDKVEDIQFMTMGIGDFAYDLAPLQVSQFESDIRINEQLDKIWFEFGGGGNYYESYTAAWQFALYHTKLDCFDKRHLRATLITMGDEKINPFISCERWNEVTGDTLEKDISTKELYKLASEKFDIYHIHVVHGYNSEVYNNSCAASFAEVIGRQKVFQSTVKDIDKTVTNIILESIRSINEAAAANTEEAPIVSNPTSIPEQLINTGITRDENGAIIW